MGAKLTQLPLTNDAKLQLQALRRKPSTPAALSARAEMILLAAQGLSNADIARRVRCRPHLVGKWRERFVQGGVSALADRARSGRPATITERETRRVVMTACRQPPKDLSRWSVRTLARRLELPHARVQRILAAHDLHPHRIRTFTFSPDPQFEEKLLEVVGLYMEPPQNAVVLCVDEKTGIQALRPHAAGAAAARQKAALLDQRIRPARHAHGPGQPGDQDRQGLCPGQANPHLA